MLAAFSWLTDPEVFEVNKEKPHSDHTFYTKNGDLRQNLNGTWKFHYSEHPDSRPADFYRTDYDVTEFDSIQVPGHIQLQGYDKPQYVNTQYPWEGQEQLVPPQIPQAIFSPAVWPEPPHVWQHFLPYTSDEKTSLSPSLAKASAMPIASLTS